MHERVGPRPVRWTLRAGAGLFYAKDAIQVVWDMGRNMAGRGRLDAAQEPSAQAGARPPQLLTNTVGRHRHPQSLASGWRRVLGGPDGANPLPACRLAMDVRSRCVESDALPPGCLVVPSGYVREVNRRLSGRRGRPHSDRGASAQDRPAEKQRWLTEQPPAAEGAEVSATHPYCVLLGRGPPACR